MTEAEWLAATNPMPMLEYLLGPLTTEFKNIYGRQIPFQSYSQRKVSDRKLRLFAVACCRRFWNLLDEKHCERLSEVGAHFGGQFNPVGLPLDSCQKAIEVAERSADETVAPEIMESASNAADLFHFPAQDYTACYDEGQGRFDSELVASGEAAYAVYNACGRDIESSVKGAIIRSQQAAIELLRNGFRDGTEGRDALEKVAQSAVMRDIFGNPFRCVVVTPSWLTSDVVALAEGIYQDRAFDRMPILADALMDADCDNEDILNHCRQVSEHVRGCWVVDLLTGRK